MSETQFAASQGIAPRAVKAGGPLRGSNWSLQDIVDFEFLLEADRRADAGVIEERDRSIYQNHIRPHAIGAEAGRVSDRRRLFRQWLEVRREESGPGQPWPGEVLAGARRLLSKGLIVAGLILGAGASAQLLRYDGVQPVNVAAFLGWLVALQLVLVLIAALAVLFRRAGFLSSEISLFSGLVRWLWTRLAAQLGRHALDRFPAGRREQFKAFLGLVASRESLYRPAIAWPLTGWLQLFGVCFNLGVIAVTLALVLFSDRAFGWQSAIRFSADQVHDVLRIVALPWSWLYPEGTGFPSLAQIEGSRIVLKDGIRQLTTENLVSWWPFLCLSAVTYGLLPRGLLLCLCHLLGRRALRRLSFEQATCDRLHERLLAGELRTAGCGEETPRRELPDDPIGPARPGEPAPAGPVPANSALLLAEPELLRSLDESDLRERIRRRFHLELASCQPAVLNPIDLARVMGPWTNRQWRDGAARIVLLQEAWEPPIAENINAVRLIRQTFGPSARILVTLIGRPSGGNPLTVTRESEWKNWERRLAALGDPMLRLERLVEHA